MALGVRGDYIFLNVNWLYDSKNEALTSHNPANRPPLPKRLLTEIEVLNKSGPFREKYSLELITVHKCFK